MDDQKNNGKKVPIGMVAEKADKASNSEDFEGSMFGDNISEVPQLEEEVPPMVQNKLDRLEEHASKLNLDVKEKNEKILELLGELEDVKI